MSVPEPTCKGLTRFDRESCQADFQHCPGCPDVHGGQPWQWQPVLREMVQAMRDYEMDVDEPPPHQHRAMMERAERLLADHGGEREDRLTPEEREEVEYFRKWADQYRTRLVAILDRLAPRPDSGART